MGPTYQQAPPAYILANHMEMLSGDLMGVDYATISGVPELDGSVVGYNPFNIKAIMYQTYLAGSPYAEAAAYDPSEELDAMEDALGEYLQTVEDWDPAAEWGAAADAVSTKADTLFPDSAQVTAEVAAYQNRTQARYAREVGQVMSNYLLADAADEGTGVPQAIALLAAQRGYELADFEQKLVDAQYRERAAFINAQTNVYLNNANAKRSTQRDAYALQGEYQTRRIVAGKEFIAEELQFLVKDSTFGLDLFQHGGSMIGAISGAPNLVPGPTKEQTALSVLLGVGSMIIPLL